MFYITKYTLNRTTHKLTNINFYSGHNSTTNINYAVIRIGGTWYAWSTGVAQTTAVGTQTTAFQNNALLCNFNVDEDSTTGWQPLSLSGTGTTLVRGTGGALPSGDIDGWGMLVEKTAAATSRVGFDTLEASADVRAVSSNQGLPIFFFQ